MSNFNTTTDNILGTLIQLPENLALQASYEFNSNDSSAAIDSSGAGRNIAAAGTPYIQNVIKRSTKNFAAYTPGNNFGGTNIGNGTNTGRWQGPIQNWNTFTGSFAVEAWVYLPSDKVTFNPGYGVTGNFFVGTGGPNSGGPAFGTKTIDGNPYLAFESGNGTVLRDTSVFPTNQWVHVAAVFNASTTTTKLYLNSVEVASSNSIVWAKSGSPTVFAIGAREFNWVWAQSWNGYLSDLRIFKTGFVLNGQLTNLDEQGNGLWNQVYYINGQQTNLDSSGKGVWNNTIYVNGVPNLTYTGWISQTQTYYVGGQATNLDQSGYGVFEGKLYFNGVLANRWDNNGYYVGGVLTTLDIDGNGTWNDKMYFGGYLANGWDSINSTGYYIDGVLTPLDIDGNGTWNDKMYLQGSIANGWDWWNSTGYYIDGVLTTLDMDGNGTWNDKMYFYGGIAWGWDWWNWSGYYFDGILTTLDMDGSGFWDNKAYVWGYEQPTGWNNYFYYIDNVETTLNQDGNGTWNGSFYSYGVAYEDPSGPVNLTNNLQAFYKLDDLTDSSGNGNTLTNIGDITFSSGKIGNCAAVNADNHEGGKYFITPVSGGLGSGFTYSTWIRWNSNTLGGAFAQAVTGDFSGWFMAISDAGNLAYLAGEGNGWIVAEEFTNVVADEWHHVVKVADNNGVKIYVNGQLTNIWSNSLWTSANIEIGHYAYNYGSQDWSWNGQIDAVGIWNRALNASEVAALYNSGTGLELPQDSNIKNGWINNIYWINDVATTLDQNGDGKWQGKLYEAGSLFSGTKYSLTFVDGLAQPENIVTVIGNNIPVAFGLNEAEEPLVELVFASITSAGETVIEQIIPTVLPTGYTVAETILAYSIDTTATFEGSINVDFILPSNTSQIVFDRVKCFHVKDDGSIEEMTRVSSDFSTKRITVAITSFSDFLFLDEPQTGKFVKIQGNVKFYGNVKFVN